MLFLLIFVSFLASARCLENMPSVRYRLDAVEKMIESAGYTSETHYVTTEDGYILAMHRIPQDPNSGGPKRGPVFLQHGLLCSSADWVVMGPNKGLAFILSDAGYDVWMGNARGNTYSRNHTKLNLNRPSDQAKFWAFSWHEIGYYDLPAMIDHVLHVTSDVSLQYVGHSQGSTSFLVMTSLRPEYNTKVRSAHALAPVAYMSNMVSPFVRGIAPFTGAADFISKMMGMNEFLPSTKLLADFGQVLCNEHAITKPMCSNVIFILCGFDSDQLNTTALPEVLKTTPAGSSTRQILHFAQGVRSAKFSQYDFGSRQNKKIYGQFIPPNYPLHKVRCPVALHYSDNDWMASVKDVDILSRQLPNLIGKFRVPYPKWNHLDYQWGIDAKKLVYDRVLSLMNRYN